MHTIVLERKVSCATTEELVEAVADATKQGWEVKVTAKASQAKAQPDHPALVKARAKAKHVTRIQGVQDSWNKAKRITDDYGIPKNIARTLISQAKKSAPSHSRENDVSVNTAYEAVLSDLIASYKAGKP